MNFEYVKQVALLLRVAPEISKFNEFALHGGSAINLFHHNMPRLSVDIDLTYIPFGERKKDLSTISLLLLKLSNRLKKTIPGIRIHTKIQEGEEIKLFCTHGFSTVKIEVNTINRGIMGNTELFTLCNAAQEQFECFFEMSLVPKEQLFGGKIVAALDRQHPRDLFDTMKFLDRNTLDKKTLTGFLFCLFSSNRPFNEIIQPNLSNQKNTLDYQFNGMADEKFTYQMYKYERDRLINSINSSLSNQQKNIILSFAKGEPDWIYGNWSNFPGIAWKLKNIEILKKRNPDKFKSQIYLLEKALN